MRQAGLSPGGAFLLLVACTAGFVDQQAAGATAPDVKTDDAQAGAAQAAIELFVVGGSASGKLPPLHFRTLAEARDAVRALSRAAKSRGVIVNVAAGDHRADSDQASNAAVLALDHRDSGVDANFPIVWRGQAGGAAGKPSRITASIEIPANVWEAAGHSPHGHPVYKANLSALGLHDLSDAFNTNQGQCGNDGRRSELFFGGKPMTLGRHPNTALDGTWPAATHF